MKNDSPEIWKDIPNYENLYQVSNKGRVYSIRNDLIRKLRPDKCGYPTVSLKKHGKVKLAKVHRLVLLSFQGPSSLQVNHKNGIKDDNRLENLEYCTASENLKHAFSIGLASQLGSRNAQAKVTEEDVREIRKALAEGSTTIKAVAKKYNIARTTVSQIKTGINWGHVK